MITRNTYVARPIFRYPPDVGGLPRSFGPKTAQLVLAVSLCCSLCVTTKDKIYISYI